MLINLRNALMAGKRLPYDAEVEYLESTGTQRIEIGMTFDARCVLDMTFQFTRFVNNATCHGQTAATAIQARFAFGKGASSWNDWYCGIGNKNCRTGKALDFAVHRFIVDAPGDKFVIDDTTYNVGWTSFDLPSNPNSATLYNRARVDSTDLDISGAHGKLYCCKIWQGGVLVRDYIPVRKGTVGYLYDRVSGKLFGNAGAGDFVLGQDVVPVEWLESHGTEYIDTGVVPNDMTGFRVDAMARGSNVNVRVLGVYETISGQMQRFASVLRSTGDYSQQYYFGWGAAYNFTAVESNFNKRRLMELNYLNSRKMAFDGAIVRSNLPTLPTFTTSAYLFGNRNATPLIAMRCYQCQMSEGSSLSRSYYPVRVGTEGAMMDVLTRRIYRNAGTGAFGYGNDLKYPIPAE